MNYKENELSSLDSDNRVLLSEIEGIISLSKRQSVVQTTKFNSSLNWEHISNANS